MESTRANSTRTGVPAGSLAPSGLETSLLSDTTKRSPGLLALEQIGALVGPVNSTPAPTVRRAAGASATVGAGVNAGDGAGDGAAATGDGAGVGAAAGVCLGVGLGVGRSARGDGRGDSGGGSGAEGALVIAVSPMAVLGVAEAASVRSRDNAESDPAAAERSVWAQAMVSDRAPARSTRAAAAPAFS